MNLNDAVVKISKDVWNFKNGSKAVRIDLSNGHDFAGYAKFYKCNDSLIIVIPAFDGAENELKQGWID